jgi:hypothetical protein
MDLLRQINETTLLLEDPGSLKDVPAAWWKQLIQKGAGDKSSIHEVGADVFRKTKGVSDAGYRARGKIITDLIVNAGPNVAAAFIKVEGEPFALIQVQTATNGRSNFEYRMITSEGEAATEEKSSHHTPQRREMRYYTDSNGQRQSYMGRAETRYHTYQIQTLTILQMAQRIPVDAKVDVYVFMKDESRAALAKERKAGREGTMNRQDNRSVRDANAYYSGEVVPKERFSAHNDAGLKQIKQQAVKAFIKSRASDVIETAGKSIAGKLTELSTQIDNAVNLASEGKDFTLSAKSLSNITNDLDKLSRVLNSLQSLSKKGIRGTYNKNEKSWEYSRFLEELQAFKNYIESGK